MAKLKFNGGSPELKLERSSFNLSNFTMFDCEQGQIIPTAVYDCVPGDKFNLSTSSLIRTTPLIKPAYTVDLMQKTASFFVAYRTLYKEFEDFFSGGRTGNKVVPLPVINLTLLMNYISTNSRSTSNSIFDYFGLPIKASNPTIGAGAGNDYINAFYFLAYIKVWNDYFRNPSIDIEVDVLELSIYYPLDDTPVKSKTLNTSFVYNGQSINVLDVTSFVMGTFATINGLIPSSVKLPDNFGYPEVIGKCTDRIFSMEPFKVNLNRDLFTSALPTFSNLDPVSYGLIGALSSSGNLFDGSGFAQLQTYEYDTTVVGGPNTLSYTTGSNLAAYKLTATSSKVPSAGGTPSITLGIDPDSSDGVGIFGSSLNNILLPNANLPLNISGIYPRELRLVFGLDLNQQLRNLTGSRYQDLLKAFYGVTVRDYRLNLAEYIGGSRQPVYISEVLQTSETSSTPLGEQGGHAIASGYGKHGSYFVEELGCIINLFWINSTSLYTQGIRRDWRKFLFDDFFFSSFENLGDQEIFQEELVYTFGGSNTTAVEGPSYNQKIFGFSPRYSEYKYYNDTVVGGFRGNYRYWTQARIFGIKDISGTLQGYPVLSPEFIKPDFSQNNRIFQTIDADFTLKPYLVKFENRTIAFRPMKQNSIGYLIDHF